MLFKAVSGRRKFDFFYYYSISPVDGQDRIVDVRTPCSIFSLDHEPYTHHLIASDTLPTPLTPIHSSCSSTAEARNIPDQQEVDPPILMIVCSYFITIERMRHRPIPNSTSSRTLLLPLVASDVRRPIQCSHRPCPLPIDFLKFAELADPPRNIFGFTARDRCY